MIKKTDEVSKKQERQKRLSEALRLNLYKRKQQQRVRETLEKTVETPLEKERAGIVAP